MKALTARLREPGTLRSVALALFALKALLPDSWGMSGITADDIQNLLSLAILLLAGTSAAMPAQGVAAVAKVEAAAEQVTDAARATQQAVSRVAGSAKGYGL
jgi:hypothetical protein